MNETEEIKSRLSIEEVVGSYIPLRKAGRILKANCPFHNEKTPSFTVSADRGIYKCFGCGEGGDIFDFVMKIEGLTFPEALNLLADKAGVVLPEKEGFQKPEGPSKERLVRLNTYAARLWNTILTQHPKAEDARHYLYQRGLTEQTIADFQIGFAPSGATNASSFTKAGFTPQEQQAAGEPARFQQRITFPIADLTGKVVGFTGRLLEIPGAPPTSKPQPKYWNTPETPLFIKSRIVYALHLAKRAIQEEDVTILAEGQMDVVTLHQFGYTNTVASSGTALTAEQVRLLGRFSQHIAFAYDSDHAGIEATKRGIELVLAAGLTPTVITIPYGKDPAECLQQNPEAWKQAYVERQPFMRWLLDDAGGVDSKLTPERKKQLATTLLPWILKVTSQVERQDYLRQLAGLLLTSEEVLTQALQRLQGIQPLGNSPEPAAENSSNIVQYHPLPTEIATALLIAFPKLFAQVRSQIDTLQQGEQRPLVAIALPIFAAVPPDGQLENQLASLQPEQSKELSLLVQPVLQHYEEQELDEGQALAEIFVLLRRVRSEAKEHVKVRLSQQIRQAQESGNAAAVQELFAELKNLI